MTYPLILAGVILLAFMPLYLYSKNKWSMPVQLTLKAVSTMLCVCVALGYNAGTGFQELDATLILIGLVLCVVGDVMLEINFPIGGGFFFLGHVAYVAAFVSRGLSAWSILALAICAGFVAPVYVRYRSRMPAHLRLPVAGYGIALCMLGAAALPQVFTQYSTRSLLGALGAGLFIASDLTLCRNLLEKLGFKHQYISLGMYYMGQLLLALSAVV